MDHTDGRDRPPADEGSAAALEPSNLSAGSLPGAASLAAAGAAALGARRSALWLYEPSARELVLVTSADGTPGARVAHDDPRAPAARGLRLDAPELDTSTSPAALVVPLGGPTAPIGALVVEGPFALDGSGLMERAAGVRLLLSSALEGRRVAEHERELQARLAETARLRAAGQSVAEVAHEMNNLLQGVLGQLEALLDSGGHDAAIHRGVRRIYQEAERAATIVRNLMIFSGSRPVTRRRLRIARIVARALASREALLRKQRIAVARRDAPGLPWLAGDPLLLHQVFLNVLVNAEQAVLATGREGRIEVHTGLDPQSSRIVATIRDTGPGIPPEVLPRIFDPFFTTKESGKGTGLGLALASGIIRDHGGSIRAGNAPGGGAVFTIELPALDA